MQYYVLSRTSHTRGSFCPQTFRDEGESYSWAFINVGENATPRYEAQWWDPGFSCRERHNIVAEPALLVTEFFPKFKRFFSINFIIDIIRLKKFWKWQRMNQDGKAKNSIARGNYTLIQHHSYGVWNTYQPSEICQSWLD